TGSTSRPRSPANASSRWAPPVPPRQGGRVTLTPAPPAPTEEERPRFAHRNAAVAASGPCLLDEPRDRLVTAAETAQAIARQQVVGAERNQPDAAQPKDGHGALPGLVVAREIPERLEHFVVVAHAADVDEREDLLAPGLLLEELPRLLNLRQRSGRVL